jgi:hypothetical protein
MCSGRSSCLITVSSLIAAQLKAKSRTLIKLTPSEENMKLKPAIRRGIFLFLCALLCVMAAHAQGERILDFHSDIRVQDDATMQVVETIRVVSAGNQIRHGIYRDFPTRYADRLGNHYVVGLDVLGAARDDAREDFRVEDYANGKRIYLGRANFLVPSGEHNYTLSYTTTRQIGFFADHDELFWNVTGNGWIFPIVHSSATVRLPGNIPADKVGLGGYTGPQGSLAHDLSFTKDEDRSYAFMASRPLRAQEGLTILLTWPKGFVAAPTSQEKLQYFLQDNHDAAVAAVGLSAILLYYVVVWLIVGRDPAPGPIVARYEPPAGFTPAGMRYLVRMSYDNKAFASAVLDMAVKGYLLIKEEAGTYTLTPTGRGRTALSPEEQAAADVLFAGGFSIPMRNENHVRISAAMAALKKWLRNTEYKTYFVTNGVYMVPAVALFILMMLSIIFSQSPLKIGMAAAMTVWLTMWSLGVSGSLSLSFQLWKTALAGGQVKSGITTTAAIFITAISLVLLSFEVLGLVLVATSVSFILVAALVSSLICNALFHHLLRAPTRAGRAALDNIEGFKRFLVAVDGDRMSRVTASEKTPEMFEKFLPYALALDVEQAWANQFSGVLARAGTNGQSSSTYSPSWYSGNSWNNLGASGFVSSLSGSFSSAISSSSSAPGSSSGGGGGGGGSGGGGGGGGGGGW